MTRSLMIAMLLLTAAIESLDVDAATMKGVVACRQWTSSRGTNSANANEMWLIGFLSGMEVASRTDLLKGTQASSLAAWMDGFCRRSPDSNVGQGAVLLFGELSVTQKQ